MKVDEIYGSSFLKAVDLPKPVRVRIERVEVGTFSDQKTGDEQLRFVLHFKGAKKSLIVNKTHARAIAGLLGDESDDWAGREIVLASGVAPSGQPTIVISPAVAAEGESAF